MSEAGLAVTPGAQLGAQEWDRLLLAQPEGNLLQSWKWGELQARFGWTVERLAFHGGRTGVCSLQRSATLIPGGAVYYAPRGPAVAEPERLQVLDTLEHRAADGGGLVLRVEPNAGVGDEWPAFFEGRGYAKSKAVQPEATRLLRIDAEPESLKAGFKPKTRYNLNLAERRASGSVPPVRSGPSPGWQRILASGRASTSRALPTTRQPSTSSGPPTRSASTSLTTRATSSEAS